MTISKQQQSDYAYIHIAKKQLGLSDEEYRAILHGVTGKTSLKEMDFTERYRVKQHLKKLGFKPKPKKKQGNKRYSPLSRKTVTDVIRAIWIGMAKDGLIRDGSETALDKWVKRMTKSKYNNGLGIEAAAFLERAGADVYVLEALKKYRDRLEDAQAKQEASCN